MSNVPHTPLPWYHVPADNVIATKTHPRLIDVIARSVNVSVEERDANVSFIVRACNSHYELLEACRSALSTLRTINSRQSTPYDTDFLEQAITKATTGGQA